MDLRFKTDIGEKYHGPTQKARVITEAWVLENLYCPFCGSDHLKHFDNNKPVADFYCDKCGEEFELKSMSKPIGKKINGSSYKKMIERITSYNNPNFLFMHYDKDEMMVNNLVLIPKYYFTPDIVERRKPLSDNAKRAGWVGCKFLIGNIPQNGYIMIVKNGDVIEKNTVVSKTGRTSFMSDCKIEARGWLTDVMKCIDAIDKGVFTIQDVYRFENELAQKYPNNMHIKDKIRQMLQVLRDKGIIAFEQRGVYRKI